MRNKLIICLSGLLVFFAIGCGGAAEPAKDKAKVDGEDKSGVAAITEAEVKDALEALRAAVEKNDSEALGKIYSDDYHLVNPQGKVETKADRMAVLKDGKIKYEKVEFADSKIRTYENTAVVVTNAKGKANQDGKDTDLDMTATIVFVKTKDGVGEVSAQLTNRAKEE